MTNIKITHMLANVDMILKNWTFVLAINLWVDMLIDFFCT